MKIDFSTITLILSLVVPGLIAKRSQRRLSSQSFEPAGPTIELGELVALSLVVHLILLLLLTIVGLGIALTQSLSIFAGLHIVDNFDYRSWGASHLFRSYHPQRDVYLFVYSHGILVGRIDRLVEAESSAS